ncbi:MAG: DUF692 domain-containing protein [Polyangiales bacterium]
MSAALRDLRVGVGWRPEIAGALLEDRARVDFVEVVAETCFIPTSTRREVMAVAEVWPVIPHGVKLSLGSAEGIDVERAKKLGALARDLKAPCVTEHVSFVRAGGHEVGHLTQLPRTRAAVEVVARNVDLARRHLGDVPLVLENVAWTVRWPDDEMSEADFYAEVVARTGCDLMLDVSNLHANAINEGLDPRACLRAFPLERVVMAHMAGGRRVAPDFFLDSHADPVPEAVFTLLADLASLRGAVPVILERDADFPHWRELAAELDRARALTLSVASAPVTPPVAPAPPVDLDLAPFAAAQSALAASITEPPESTAPPPPGFDPAAVARTRELLQRKRVDDALPLLPRLMARRSEAEAAALPAVCAAPRAPRHNALTDAWRIATALTTHPPLGPAARLDALVLRARTRALTVDGVAVRAPRDTPFVGRVALPGGGSVWALKSLGSTAAVRVVYRGGGGARG